MSKEKARKVVKEFFKNDKQKDKEARKEEKGGFLSRFFNDPKYIGMVLIFAFFVAFLISMYGNVSALPVFVICTISVILSITANIWNYTFLNSIVIGYWGIYLITIADVFFLSGAFGIHLINLILATSVLIRRWRNSWPWLIFVSGFLWATVIGTENQVTNGASEYFRIFDWKLLMIFVGFDLFIALIVWLGQNPRNKDKPTIGNRRNINDRKSNKNGTRATRNNYKPNR